jgi:hypothetical protein
MQTIMARTQKTRKTRKTRKLSRLRPKAASSLLFWQGYLFALGVGGLLLSMASFLGKNNLLALLCHSFALYGGAVGYAAASVWRMPSKQIVTTPRAYKQHSVIHATLLCVPLLLFKCYQETGVGLSSLLTTGMWFHSGFCLLFTIVGIWLGGGKEEAIPTLP